LGFFYFYTMNIKQYLDSTYLKKALEAGITEQEDKIVVTNCIQEAINESFKLIMIRPNHVRLAKKMIADCGSKVLIGTVIDFPNGKSSIGKKLEEAEIAINNGADELDFVINYTAFKNKETDLVKKEIFEGTNFCLSKNKTIKWIIEIAALTDVEITTLSTLIKEVVTNNFKEKDWQKVFVKSSTGFFKTENNLPNGATIAGIKLMLEAAKPLPIKAAGGVKNYQEATEMIQIGVSRIGTSNAKNIIENRTTGGY
jgi:deoxyribose-phosphate aldolase